MFLYINIYILKISFKSSSKIILSNFLWRVLAIFISDEISDRGILKLNQAHDKKAFFLQSNPLLTVTLNLLSASKNVPFSLSYVPPPSFHSSDCASTSLPPSRQ